MQEVRGLTMQGRIQQLHARTAHLVESPASQASNRALHGR